MINNLYSIATKALQNAQVSIDNASNNIANADTVGYQRTEVNYETSDSISIYGLSLGTGADVESILSQMDKFVEAQYLSAYADLSCETAALEYLSQLDSLLNQSDGGLNDTLSDFLTAWNDLTTDPDSLSAREALLGETETLIYALTSTIEQLESSVDAIDAEIQTEVSDANSLIDDIAALNAAIMANPGDNQAISDRDQLIRELDAIIGVETLYKESGSVTILTEEGYTMVDDTETHHLVYSSPKVTQSLLRDSTYEGSLEFEGETSEELLLEFVSTGADGTAQFRVSTDGGDTWLEDENGDTMLYTAGDENNSVEVDGVEIWFDGSGDHEAGDRYTIVAKTGLYWEGSDGSLTNITPMTDASGQDVSGRVSGGSLAGLFTVRDDVVTPTMDSLDELAESIIWEVNSAHAQGAGTEHHTALTGSYEVEDSSALLSNSGLYFADQAASGEIQLITYDEDGAVSTSAILAFDLDSDSLDDLVADINAAFGGELTASINADGQFQLDASGDMTFEIAGDTTNLMAALGVNTYFTGTDASTIAVDSYAAQDVSHINAGSVGDDGLVASGSNDVATAITGLSTTTITVDGMETTLSQYLAGIVSDVGSAASSAELQQAYAQTSAEYLYNQQASASEVNIDEELIELTKQQQAYQAAAEIISVTRAMMDTILDIV
ncbi:flagellar hook-associated protein FlgK [Pseudodesulfovibrio portus]|uniref:Flagellar hook-associated protein 1 n=1 Tax=Pseudodesulfovibrio portus TaxID=231439 RepID=A0ABN6S062_9BACT|nr:flagellar basal body rod C-terminal domain-containing protein [Pseudodesulfovibrio portus]BDQ35506.1 flagellar hook-associated protein FlgK [Pseudodesulfovibrio portus]